VRVVSLVPSVTETLLAWDVPVVACTRFCEQPTLPHVGGTKDPDVAAIVALAPDLVVVDREENRRVDAERLIAEGVAVHVTHVVDVDGVPPMLQQLALAVKLRAPNEIAVMGVGALADLSRTRSPSATSASTSARCQRRASCWSMATICSGGASGRCRRWGASGKSCARRRHRRDLHAAGGFGAACLRVRRR
jgi:hypothetical protein